MDVRQVGLPPAGWPALTVELLAGADRVYDATWASGRPVISDDFTRLYRVRRGDAEITCRGVIHRLRPGVLGLIPAGTAASYRSGGLLHLAWLHLRLETAPGIDLWQRHPGVHVRPLGRHGPALDRALAAIGGARPSPALAATAALLDLLAGFAPAAWATGADDAAALAVLMPALRALQREPDRPWSLAQLAAQVHRHPTYLANRFSERFGCGPMHFLHRLRLRRARRLLLTTTEPIGRIAGQCGYDDPLYFSRRFRADAGVPPTAYRRLRSGWEG
jgi:AraC-like DNA-binding protein